MDIPILEFHYHPSPFCQGYGLLVKRTFLQGFNFLFKNFQQNYYLAPHINKLKTYTYLLSCLYFWVFEWCALICCSLFKLVTSSIAAICVFWKSGSTVGHAANKVTNTMVIKVTVTFCNFTGIVL